MEEDKLYCPNCGSTHLTANKKGFGAGKAAAGAVLTGGIGLLAGFIGSGDVKVTCLNCGQKYEPGQLRTSPLPRLNAEQRRKKKEREQQDKMLGCGLFIAMVLFFCILFMVFKSLK